jgi:hypothetical protein
LLFSDRESNHPPTITKNLSASINKRLSSISCNKEEFDKAAPLYMNALAAIGYSCKLEFNPQATSEKQNNRNRSRKVAWINPLFSQNVKTKVGEKL